MFHYPSLAFYLISNPRPKLFNVTGHGSKENERGPRTSWERPDLNVQRL